MRLCASANWDGSRPAATWWTKFLCYARRDLGGADLGQLDDELAGLEDAVGVVEDVGLEGLSAVEFVEVLHETEGLLGAGPRSVQGLQLVAEMDDLGRDEVDLGLQRLQLREPPPVLILQPRMTLLPLQESRGEDWIFGTPCIIGFGRVRVAEWLGTCSRSRAP